MNYYDLKIKKVKRQIKALEEKLEMLMNLHKKTGKREVINLERYKKDKQRRKESELCMRKY